MWLAGVVPVDLVAERGHLHRAAVFDRRHRPEGRAHRVHGVGPVTEDRRRPIGTGVGGEVEVLDPALEEGVAHRSPHQEQLMPGRLEAAGELGRGQIGGDQEFEPLRDHPVRLKAGVYAYPRTLVSSVEP